MRYTLPSVVLCLWLVLAGTIAGTAAGAVDGAVPVERFESGQAGRVAFPTRNVDGFYDLYNGDKTYTSRGLATLVLPAAAPVRADGYCAMVILHGSGGEWSGRGARHAGFLSENGIAAFNVDTYVSRGIARDMRYLERLRRVNIPDQIADAFAALDILATHPDIDARCIGVMGYSMGGMASFLAAFEDVARAASPHGRRFALHAAFYAPCAYRAENPRMTGAPILALWGERDQSTERESCTRYARLLRDGGAPLTDRWLAGAAHGWNGTGEMKYHPSAPRVEPCRFVIVADGELVEHRTWRRARTDRQMIDVLAACSASGYIIGRHDEANETANRALLDFIGDIAAR